MTDTIVTQTDEGPVRGITDGRVDWFVEIPYAASTAGAGRFAAPRPVHPWSEVRDATQWRWRAPQSPDPAIGRTPRQWFAIQGMYYAPGISEDCLTLNVWTPESTDERRRPVLVWLHGGGFTHGHAASDMTDGANFARTYDTVFVSVTHRLNSFGFLHLASLAGADYATSGVNGLLDIVAALDWVQHNIASFGGDPDNVTIIGESGGGAKVSHLLAMPTASGKFHRAVCESGVALTAGRVADSEAYAAALVKELGASDPGVLFEASMEALLQAQLNVERDQIGIGVRPVRDGLYIPEVPERGWFLNQSSQVPLLVGSCRNEITAFGYSDLGLELALDVPQEYLYGIGEGERPPFEPTIDDVSRIAGQDAEPLAAVVRRLNPEGDERQTALALMSSLVFERPATVIAEAWDAHGSSVYVYRLDWASPRLENLGAPHGIGVPLFFLNPERVAFTRGLADASELATEMSSSLAHFMQSGSPGHGWHPYEADRRTVRIFDQPVRDVDDPDSMLRVALAAAQPASLL